MQVKAYVLCHPELCAILVGGDETITCSDLIVTEIGDGNLNFVYLVKTKLDHSSNGTRQYQSRYGNVKRKTQTPGQTQTQTQLQNQDET